MAACGTERHRHVTSISFVPSRNPLTSPKGECTSPVSVRCDGTSTVRRRYLSSVSDDGSHLEQISFIPVSVNSAPSTRSRGIDGTEIDQPPSRVMSSRRYTSTSSTSDDGTNFVEEVTFVIGVEDPGKPTSCFDADVVEKKIRFTDRRVLPSESTDVHVMASDIVQLAINKAVRQMELQLPAEIAEGQRPSRVMSGSCATTGSMADNGRNYLQEDPRIAVQSSTFVTERRAQFTKQQSPPSAERTDDDDQLRLMASDIIQVAVSKALRQLDQHLPSTNQQNAFSASLNFADKPCRIQPTYTGSRRQKSVQPSSASEAERHEQLVKVKSCRSRSFRLSEDVGPNVGGDNKYTAVIGQPMRTTLQPVHVTSEGCELFQLPTDVQTERHEMTISDIGLCRRLLKLPLSESPEHCESKPEKLELTVAEDELLVSTVGATEEQLDEGKTSHVFAEDQNEISPIRLFRTSTRSSDSGGNVELEKEEKEVSNFQVSSKPSTDTETFDSKLERRVAQEDKLMIVDEPGLQQIFLQHETRTIRRQSSHEEEPNISRLMELLTAGQFSAADIEKHADDVKQLDEDKCFGIFAENADRNPTERHSSTPQCSISEGGVLDVEDEVESFRAPHLRSSPFSTDGEATDSRRISDEVIVHEPSPEQQNGSPQSERRGLKQRTTEEKWLTESLSTESLAAEQFTTADFERLDDIPPATNSLQARRQISSEDDKDSRSNDSDYYAEEVHRSGGSAATDEAENIIPEDDLADVRITPPILVETTQVALTDQDASFAHAGTASATADPAASVNALASDVHTNKGDTGDNGEDMTAESDSAVKRRLSQMNASVNVLENRQLSADEVFEENKEFSRSPASNRFGGIWATPYRSQSSCSTEESANIRNSSQPNNICLDSPPAVERPYFYADENRHEQFTGDHKLEFGNVVPVDVTGDNDGRPVPSQTSNNVVETYSWSGWSPEDELAPLIVDEENIDTAIAPVEPSVGLCRSWKSYGSSEDSDTSSGEQSYDRPNDSGLSDGLSTEQEASSGRQWMALENSSSSDVEGFAAAGSHTPTGHSRRDNVDKSEDSRDVEVVRTAASGGTRIKDKVTEEDIMSKPSFVTEDSAKTIQDFETDLLSSVCSRSSNMTGVIEKQSLSKLAVQTEVDLDEETVQVRRKPNAEMDSSQLVKFRSSADGKATLEQNACEVYLVPGLMDIASSDDIVIQKVEPVPVMACEATEQRVKIHPYNADKTGADEVETHILSAKQNLEVEKPYEKFDVTSAPVEQLVTELQTGVYTESFQQSDLECQHHPGEYSYQRFA